MATLQWELKRKERRNKDRIDAYKRGNYGYGEGKEAKKEKRVFMKGCPINGCRGFLSTQWKCGICKIFVCNKCLEPIGNNKEEEHECNEDSVKTAEMLKKETKNCPSCAAVIFKISGCDQMWCTQCHIAFSWKTGQTVQGVIHNPHFYQWQRNNGGATQNPEAVHCGGLPAYHYFRNKLRTFRDIIGVDMTNKLMNYHRGGNHFSHIELRDVRRKVQHNTDNIELRVKYLAKEITEFDVKKKLVSRDTAKMKARAILDIYELFNNVMTECLVTIYNMNVDSKFCQSLKDEVDKITRVRIYCNNQLRTVSCTYRQCVKLIDPSLYTESVRMYGSEKECSKMNKKYFIQPYKWVEEPHKLKMEDISV